MYTINRGDNLGDKGRAKNNKEKDIHEDQDRMMPAEGKIGRKGNDGMDTAGATIAGACLDD